MVGPEAGISLKDRSALLAVIHPELKVVPVGIVIPQKAKPTVAW
jgi:hypothetical protein